MTQPAARSSLATSPGGQWVAIRRGEQISLLSGGGGAAAAKVDIGSDDADVAFVGPPPMLVVLVRNVAPRVMLYQPPNLEVVARHDLDRPMNIVAITGQRVALLSADHKRLAIVRIAPTALAAQSIDLDAPADFVVGLDKNQLLVSVQRKLEVWDATTGRPSLRMQLQLPPPPRTVGAAQGHVWVTRPSADDVILYRLSDGRPFRHVVGAPTTEVVANPASPILVVGTARGLVRLHCFAHSLTVVDAPWTPGTPTAQLVVNDENITLLGLGDGAEPWRVPLVGSGAPVIPRVTDPVEELSPPKLDQRDPVVRFRPSDKLPRLGTQESPPAAEPERAHKATVQGFSPAPVEPEPAQRAATAQSWREVLAGIGADLVNGNTPELAPAIDDSELATLADRLLLGKRAIRALIALYSVYLVGEPELSIADLAQILGDWTEPLGTGELGALAMLNRDGGRITLREAVTDLLDGVPPRSVRLVGTSSSSKPRSGAWRFSRETKSDAEIETLLAAKLGRIAVVERDPDRALLEARLHNATAVAFAPPERKPHPWPRDAGLVLVLYGSSSSWLADLPTLAD